MKSNRKLTRITPLLTVLLSLSVHPSFAQWIPGGIPTWGHQIVPDGAGGVLVGGNISQRYNSSGVNQWSSAYFQLGAGRDVVSDGQGGLLFAWEEGTTGSVRVHTDRISSSGSVLWGDLGTQVFSGTDAFNSVVCSDGSGGAIVAWEDNRTGSNHNVYAQRVNSNGTIAWAPNGVPICDLPNLQGEMQIISDGSGGAIIVWRDQRNGMIPHGQDLYAQRVSSAGTVLWTLNGTTVCNAPSVQEFPVMVSDGAGGAMIAWVDFRSGSTHDIYAQRLDSSGVPLWTPNGVAVAVGSSDQILVTITSDGAQGAIATWQESQGSGDIYAQRISAAGATLWGSGGVSICTESHVQRDPIIAPDGSGGAIIHWLDARLIPPNYYDASFVQRVDASGTVLWTPNGVLVTTISDLNKGLASDGLGGAYVSWGARLQRILPDGSLAWPLNYMNSWNDVVDEPSDQGGWVHLKINRPLADGGGLDPGVTFYNVWRRIADEAALSSIELDATTARELVDRGLHEPVRLDASTAAAAGFPPGAWETLGPQLATQSPTYTFLAPTHDDSSAAGPADDTFLIVTHTPSIYVVGPPASGHSVDNLPPHVPQNLTGWQTGETSAQLNWSANRQSDVVAYGVYKGTSASFVPAPENRLGLPAAPGWTDPAFEPGVSHYKVAAFDRNGNHSGYALLTPTQITSAGPGGIPSVSYLARLAPNPARSAVSIEYGLARGGQVALAVFDLRGRMLRRLVDREQEAGIHRLSWDGRDSGDRQVAPGAYWVRLTGPGIEKSARLIWLD